MNTTASNGDTPTQFLDIKGPGRCLTCNWHVDKQGHHPQCTGGEVTATTGDTPRGSGFGPLPWWSDEEVIAHVAAIELDPARSYMAHADLLPKPEHFTELKELDTYVRELKRLERAVAAGISLDGSPETNRHTLAEWYGTQRHNYTDKRKRSYAIKALDGRKEELARLASYRDVNISTGIYYLAKFVNDGQLERDELLDAILDAAHANGHVRDNKSEEQITKDVDRGIETVERQGILPDWDDIFSRRPDRTASRTQSAKAKPTIHAEIPSDAAVNGPGVGAGDGISIEIGAATETSDSMPNDPRDYFARDGLQVKDLADAVMRSVTCGYGARDGRLYVYNEGVWMPDDGRIGTEIAARLANRYRKMHSSNTMDMIRFSPHIPRITCDPVPDYINVRNGMIDWRSGNLLPHKPEYLSTVQLPVEYNPDAKCPRFDKFLSDVLPPDCIEFIWELIAYTVYSGNPFHLAVLLYGKGRNGKGTLIRVLKQLLGASNTSSVTLYELVDNRFRSSTLYGKLANLAGDLDGRWLDNTAIFKAMTGGDTIQGELKHGAIFDFTPWAVPFYSMNKPFSSADSSEGWWARWTVVPFPNTFMGNENRNLDSELQTDNELQGILAHAVRVLPTVIKRGRLQEPYSVREAKKQFIASSDSIRSFVDSECEIDPNAWTLKTNLYRGYSQYAINNGSKVMSNREFYNRIEQIGGVQEHRQPGTGARGFQGIRLIGQPDTVTP